MLETPYIPGLSESMAKDSFEKAHKMLEDFKQINAKNSDYIHSFIQTLEVSKLEAKLQKKHMPAIFAKMVDDLGIIVYAQVSENIFEQDRKSIIMPPIQYQEQKIREIKAYLDNPKNLKAVLINFCYLGIERDVLGNYQRKYKAIAAQKRLGKDQIAEGLIVFGPGLPLYFKQTDDLGFISNFELNPEIVSPEAEELAKKMLLDDILKKTGSKEAKPN